MGLYVSAQLVKGRRAGPAQMEVHLCRHGGLILGLAVVRAPEPLLDPVLAQPQKLWIRRNLRFGQVQELLERLGGSDEPRLVLDHCKNTSDVGRWMRGLRPLQELRPKLTRGVFVAVQQDKD